MPLCGGWVTGDDQPGSRVAGIQPEAAGLRATPRQKEADRGRVTRAGLEATRQLDVLRIVVLAVALTTGFHASILVASTLLPAFDLPFEGPRLTVAQAGARSLLGMLAYLALLASLFRGGGVFVSTLSSGKRSAFPTAPPPPLPLGVFFRSPRSYSRVTFLSGLTGGGPFQTSPLPRIPSS